MAGTDLVVNYLHGTVAAESVAECICSCGSRTTVHRENVSSDEQVREMFQQMLET